MSFLWFHPTSIILDCFLHEVIKKFNYNIQNMTQSSEDQQEIITDLLNQREQWECLPEIVPLTLKAMLDYVASIDIHQREVFELQKQKIQIQEIKLKDIDFKLMNKIGKRQMDKSLEAIIRRNTSNNKNELQSSFTSQSIDKTFAKELGLDRTMIEEVKTIAEAVLENKCNEIDTQLNRKIEQINRKVGNHEEKLMKIPAQIQNLELTTEVKSKEKQTELIRKMNSDNKMVLDFMNQHFITTQFIDNKIKDVQAQLMKSIERDIDKVMKELDAKIHEVQKIDMKQIFRKIQSKQSQHPDVRELRFKITKQFTNFVKVSQLENILQRYQEESRVINSKLQKKFANIEIKYSMLSQKIDTKSKFEQPPKQTYQKNQSCKSIKSISNSLSNIQEAFDKKLKDISKKFGKKLQEQLALNSNKIEKSLDQRVKYCCQVLQENVDKIKEESNHTDLKKMVMKVSEQVCLARYLHFGQRQCRDLILWDKQTVNILEENFIQKGSWITVISSGLYEVKVGTYHDKELGQNNCYLIVNGEPIASIQGKGKKVNCRGLVFSEPILLPAKSKVGVRVQKAFYGQAFLQIQKL